MYMTFHIMKIIFSSIFVCITFNISMHIKIWSWWKNTNQEYFINFGYISFVQPMRFSKSSNVVHKQKLLLIPDLDCLNTTTINDLNNLFWCDTLACLTSWHNTIIWRFCCSYYWTSVVSFNYFYQDGVVERWNHQFVVFLSICFLEQQCVFFYGVELLTLYPHSFSF